jgi:hypothetical protein
LKKRKEERGKWAEGRERTKAKIPYNPLSLRERVRVRG